VRQARIDFAVHYGTATPADAEVMDQLVLAGRTPRHVGHVVRGADHPHAGGENRGGYASGAFTGSQLKIIQEVITLAVFVVFAWFVLKERLAWNYAVSFALILLAVYFATAFKPGGIPPGLH
jgi:hypothetical protein